MSDTGMAFEDEQEEAWLEAKSGAELLGNIREGVLDEASSGQRLDAFLARVLSGEASRELVQQWISAGAVTINGHKVCKASTRLLTEDAWRVEIPQTTPLALVPQAIPLVIVYEDEDLLVVDKPAGMLTHPAGSEVTGTLVNALLHHCQQLSTANGVARPGIVHRLDRDTQGLLMVAKTNAAHRSLSQQLHDRVAKRQYIAITDGIPPAPVGIITAPIGRNPHQRDKMRVDGQGREAITHWETVETLGNRVAWVRFRLETGRTHQIRVHAAYRKFPLLGDGVYGRGLEKTWQIPTQGQCLQAVSLTFTHPRTGQAMSFSQPPSAAFVATWEALKSHFSGQPSTKKLLKNT